MTYLNPKYIVSDFLRTRLTDPRARISSTSSSFTATAGQTTFTLTAPSNTVSCVTAVSVNSSSKTKWVDYRWDVRKRQVIFFNGLTVGDAVVINFKYGSEWIYTDDPIDKISSLQYPRIGISILSAPGIRLGQYEAPVETSILFRIQIWAKEKSDDQVFTISGQNFYGEELTTYLAMQVAAVFTNYENDLYPAMYNYNPQQIPRDMPFDEEYQAHKKELNLELKTINIGQV
jgi:hypothetical protein